MNKARAGMVSCTFVMILLAVTLSPTISDASEDMEVTYLEEDGVIKLYINGGIAPVQHGAMLTRNGVVLWDSGLVSFGGTDTVYLADKTGQTFHDLSAGMYEVILYPRTSGDPSYSGYFTVESHGDWFSDNIVLISVAAIAIIVCSTAAVIALLHRRRRYGGPLRP